MRKQYVLGALGALLIAPVCWAGDLFVPFSLESAGVLPKGVRSVRVSTFTTEVYEGYNATGRPEALAGDFNKNVTWGELAKAQATDHERQSLLGQLDALGIEETEVVGESHGVANSRVTATVPVAAWGVTERLTLALAVPVVYSAINVDVGWTANANMSRGLDKIAATGKVNKVMENEPKLHNVAQYKVGSKGYQRPENVERTDIGDVTLAAKFLAAKDMRYAVAVVPRLVLPTGRTGDVQRLVDASSGDGQVDVGLGLVNDYYPTANWTLTGSVGYTAQLPDQQAKRIPEERHESLTPDIDHNANRDLGDIVATSMGARYKIKEVWSVGSSLGYQYKMRDHYRGGAFAAERYEWMSDETEQTLAYGQAGVSYSTVPLFMKKQFSVPLEASLQYSTALAGRNVKRANLAAFELAMYF